MDTPATLLERVQRQGDAAAWKQLVQLYTPLLGSWARRLGLQSAEVADLLGHRGGGPAGRGARLTCG